MNATILNYPGFQTLPKGIKQMLVASEAHFFDQPAFHPKEQRSAARERTAVSLLRWPCVGSEPPGFLHSLEHCFYAEL
jgi:hypothetical protein